LRQATLYNRVLRQLEKTFIEFRPILINPYANHFLPRPLANAFIKLAYLRKLSKWIEEHPLAELHEKKFDFYTSLYESQHLDDKIHYLEFGVATGDSLTWWVDHIKNTHALFTGFDTFTGLPEAWGIWQKGFLSTDGKTPAIKDERCNFEVGLFQDTLLNFLKSHRLDNRRLLVHLDADLYTSTLFVLTTLGPRLKKGDIVIFDELSSARCPEQEFRAFVDFVASFRIGYQVIGATKMHKQVAIEITQPVGHTRELHA
jgi:O-methyltransferase